MVSERPQYHSILSVGRALCVSQGGLSMYPCGSTIMSVTGKCGLKGSKGVIVECLHCEFWSVTMESCAWKQFDVPVER